MKLKKCTKCKKELELTSKFFYVDNSKSTGFHPRCRECTKVYMLETREHRLKVKKEYRKNNKKEIYNYQKVYQPKYKNKNRESLKAKSRTYKKKRRKVDKVYVLRESVGRTLRSCLKGKGFTKNSRMGGILGCDYSFLYRHLCETFELNYGIGREYIPWDMVHVDHIIPQSTATTLEKVYELNHHSNLQLLFGEDNLKKGVNLDWKL